MFAISTSAGFLPSTVWNSFYDFQKSACDHYGMSMSYSDVNLIALPFQWFMHWPAKGHSRHVQLVFIRFIRFISILVLLSEFNDFHQKPLISENVGSMSLCFRTISSVPRWTKSSRGRQTNCDVSRCQKPWSLSTMSILDYERRRETWWSFTDAFCGDFGLCRVVV